MHIDNTIIDAMDLSEQIAAHVLNPIHNEAAIATAEQLLKTLHLQRHLLAGNGNVVPLHI